MSISSKEVEMICRKDATYVVAVMDDKSGEMIVRAGGSFENQGLLFGSIMAKIVGVEDDDTKGLKKMQKIVHAIRLLMEAKE